METVMFDGNVLKFLDGLKACGVVVAKANLKKKDTLRIEAKNMYDFSIHKGQHVVIELESRETTTTKWAIGKDESIAEVFIAYSNLSENANKTFDDFYSDIGIPTSERSDFATAAMLQQVKTIEKENSNGF